MISGVVMSGWENTVSYQFCMGMGKLEVDTLLLHKNLLPKDNLAIMLRIGPGLFLMLVVLGEFCIYVSIISHLWNHDKKSLLSKTITVDMRKERNHKNVITLGGQAFSFFVEILICIYMLFHMKNTDMSDPSTMPMMIIIGSSVLSMSHFASSHELKRYLKSEWNIHVPFGP